MGKDNDKELALAINYLPYLGTDQYSPEDLQKEFFKLGLSFDVYSSKDKVYVTLSGLQESLEAGLKLFEHLLTNVKSDNQALKDLIDGILKERSDAKLNKGQILRRAMASYGKYGPSSTYTNILSEEELKSIDPEQLNNWLKDITSYKHRVFYYGSKPIEEVKQLLDENHKTPVELKDYPEQMKFTELESASNKVYFVNYDMVQAEMVMLSKGQVFDKSLKPYTSLFSEYFGSGLSSIVFQEIRESKALAYSAYAYYSTPSKKDESHYTIAYVGTQADKLKDALGAMMVLMNDMPEVVNQFKGAKEATAKKIESERITGSRIYWSYESAKKLGLDYDIRKDVYKALPDISVSDLHQFFDENISGNNYTFLVLGKRELIDFEALEKIGPVEELSLETIFNY